MKIYYNPRLKEFAKRLRKNSTLAEVLLWRELKDGKMLGYDFHRQKSIDEFIVDFFCSKLMLVIEIDGVSHEYKYDKDIARQKRLENLGITVLRFKDEEVKKDSRSVLTSIEDWIVTHPVSRYA